MAVYLTDEAVGQREDLIDNIFDISPTQTPVTNAAGTATATAIRHEWQTDLLEAADPDNAAAEGADYTYPDIDPTVRPSNFTQILRKSFDVSGTLDKVDEAGRATETGYQARKKSLAIKRDLEASVCSNNASVGGTTRKMGGARAWMTTNTSIGLLAADGGYNTGTGVVDAATDGTQRAFTKTLLDDVIQSAYTNGGMPSILSVGPYNKRVFSTFMSDADVAQQRTNTSGDTQARITAGADFYISDFGTLTVVPNLFQRERDALVLDPEYIKIATLRPQFVDTPAKTGDSEKYAIVQETTLEMCNEAAHGVIADLLTAAA